MSWVGRSLRRFEDRALLLGRGRFTADTANGAAAVRFARSPVARGRIRSIAKPDGALVFTAADLADVKPIRPLLHRPDYVPIAQPVLAGERVNYVGEARIAIGGVEDRPSRCAPAEAILAQGGSAADAARAVAAAVKPMEDLHADAAYRKDLVRALTQRALDQALGGA